MVHFYLYLANILFVISLGGLFIYLVMHLVVRDGRGLLRQSARSIGGALLGKLLELPSSSLVPEAQHLVVQEGAKESPLKAGHVFPLQVPITKIGRGEHNHIVLHDPQVSSIHVALSYEHGVWWAEDQDSRNGTFLYPASGSSRRVQDRPEKIGIGDVLQLGDTRLRLAR